MERKVGNLLLGNYQRGSKYEYYTFYSDVECEDNVAEVEFNLETKKARLSDCDFISKENMYAIYVFMDKLEKEEI